MPEYENIVLESQSLATIIYTSGTTGRPKGVVYHHRGAYLNAMGQVLSWRMVLNPVYLTIVPLFHCNNWVHTWSIPAVGGTVVCCRDITPKAIYDAIADEGVTHFCGAPIVLSFVINATPEQRRPFSHQVNVMTAAAPPPVPKPPAITAMNLRFMARAMDRPKDVLPTPGGPTKQSMGPFMRLFNFRTLKYSRIRSFTFCRS